MSSNDLEDSKYYKIKVLATDGVRTNSSIMTSVFTIDNNLQVKNFSVVYQNNTERVFRIVLNNTLAQTISNITWEFDSGQDVKNSVYNLTLQPYEEALFFIYHNYTLSGNYNVSFIVRSSDYIEKEIIGVVA